MLGIVRYRESILHHSTATLQAGCRRPTVAGLASQQEELVTR